MSIYQRIHVTLASILRSRLVLVLTSIIGTYLSYPQSTNREVVYVKNPVLGSEEKSAYVATTQCRVRDLRLSTKARNPLAKSIIAIEKDKENWPIASYDLHPNTESRYLFAVDSSVSKPQDLRLIVGTKIIDSVPVYVTLSSDTRLQNPRGGLWLVLDL